MENVRKIRQNILTDLEYSEISKVGLSINPVKDIRDGITEPYNASNEVELLQNGEKTRVNIILTRAGK